MTEGHKHRHVKVKHDGFVRRALTKPRYHQPTTYQQQMDRVDRSPYPYGVCPLTDPEHPTCYYLSILSVLHRWTGLTLEYDSDQEHE